MFNDMPNAPHTVCAVIKLQKRRSADSVFHKTYMTLQSCFKRKGRHFQSFSQSEITPFSTLIIQPGFWAGMQIWTFGQFSAPMLLYLTSPSMSARLKLSQKLTKTSCGLWLNSQTTVPG